MGGEGRGAAVLMSGLDYERVVLSGGPTGIMQACLDVVLPYIRDRKQFGKPIADFQNTQFKLAEVKTKLTVAKVFVDHCISLHLKGQLDAATASMAKYWVTDIQGETLDEMLQLHGGDIRLLEAPAGACFQFTLPV